MRTGASIFWPLTRLPRVDRGLERPPFESARRRADAGAEAGRRGWGHGLLGGLVRQFGVHALLLGQLRLELLEPLQVRGIQTAIFGLPLVVRRRTDTVLSTDLP